MHFQVKKQNFAEVVSDKELLNLDDFENEKLRWQECLSAKAILLPDQYAEQRDKNKITYICFNKSGVGVSYNSALQGRSQAGNVRHLV